MNNSMAAQALQNLFTQPALQAPMTIANNFGPMFSQILTDLQPESIAIPSILPANAAVSPPINPSFIGWAFEQASFYNYSFAEDGSPNVFSQNLIGSITNRTGGTPFLRVGGTSGDYGNYNPSLQKACSKSATTGPPQWGKPYLSIGPSFFKAFENFPGAKYVFMVPLEHMDITNTLEWAAQGLSVIGDRLEALEIGNEPDLYNWYELPKYVTQFNYFAQNLSQKFPDQLGGGKVIYQALDTASAQSMPKERLTLEDAYAAGINRTGQVKQIAYHLYQKPDPSEGSLVNLQQYIANHTAIANEMSQFIPYIQDLQAKAPGAPFVLSEVGNSLGSSHVAFRNNLGTALWNVDYQLHALSIGVTLVNNQQIVFPGFQMWEPVQNKYTAPLVRPNYYSQPFVADFIGGATASNGTVTRVLELTTHNPDLLSAYAIYEDGKLARIAIVNLELWEPRSGARTEQSLTLTGFDQDWPSVSLARLTASEGALAQSGLTYGGLEWTYESNGLEQQVGPRPSTTTIQSGSLYVTVPATSALLIRLDGGSQS